MQLLHHQSCNPLQHACHQTLMSTVFYLILMDCPISALQDYPKLSQSFYSLLEVLTQDHMNFIASLEPHVVMYILSSISEGLTALGKTRTQIKV